VQKLHQTAAVELFSSLTGTGNKALNKTQNWRHDCSHNTNQSSGETQNVFHHLHESNFSETLRRLLTSVGYSSGVLTTDFRKHVVDIFLWQRNAEFLHCLFKFLFVNESIAVFIENLSSKRHAQFDTIHIAASAKTSGLGWKTNLEVVEFKFSTVTRA
jgi:hypothetical protein